MTKDQLVAGIAEKTGLKKTDIESVLKAQAEVVSGALKEDDKVTIPGLVILGTREVAARDYPIPNRAGETKHIPAHTAPAIKATQALKDAVK